MREVDQFNITDEVIEQLSVVKDPRFSFRPAHIHFLIGAEGYDELVTALYPADDPNIDSDCVCGVSRSLAIEVPSPLKDGPYQGLRHIDYDFVLMRADAAKGSRRVGADAAAMIPAAA